MSDIKDLVDAYAAKGVMTRQEHDALISEIQRDGEVDEAESEQLSRIFKLVAENKLRIVDSEREAAEALKSKAKAAGGQPAKAKPSSPPKETEQRSPDDPYADLRFNSRRSRAVSGSLAGSAMAGGAALTREQLDTVRGATAEAPADSDKRQNAAPAFPAEAESGGSEDPLDIDFDEPAPQVDEEFFYDEGDEEEGTASDEGEAVGSSQSLAGLAGFAANQDESFIPYELETDRILRINLNGSTWVKTGSMVAYAGNINFVREGIVEHGLGRMVGKVITREGTRLTKANGKGRLYLADQGKKVTILELKNESLVVNGNDLLALQKGIKWEIRAMKQFAALIAGGLFNIHLRGMGMIAITTHFDPLVLQVTPTRPVTTDPNATVAWSGSLRPKVKTDIQAKTFVGRGSGETIQMQFQGEGFVVIQPFEEIDRQGE